jgi:hypothetical protein
VTDQATLEQLADRYLPDAKDTRGENRFYFEQAAIKQPLETLDFLKHIDDQTFLTLNPCSLFWSLSNKQDSGLILSFLLKRTAKLSLADIDTMIAENTDISGWPVVFKLNVLKEADDITAPTDRLLSWALDRDELSLPQEASTAALRTPKELLFELVRMRPEYLTPVFLHHLEPRGVETLVKDDDVCQKCLNVISRVSPEQRTSMSFFMMMVLRNSESFNSAASRKRAVEMIKKFSTEEKSSLLEYFLKHSVTEYSRMILSDAMFDILTTFEEIKSPALVQFVFEFLTQDLVDPLSVVRHQSMGRKRPWTSKEFYNFLSRSEENGKFNPAKRAEWSVLHLRTQMEIFNRSSLNRFETIARINPTMNVDFLSLAQALLEEDDEYYVITHYLKYFSVELPSLDEDPESHQEDIRKRFTALYMLSSQSSSDDLARAATDLTVSLISQRILTPPLSESFQNFLSNFLHEESYGFLERCAAEAAYAVCNTSEVYSADDDEGGNVTEDYFNFDYPKYFELMATSENPEVERELLRHYPTGMTVEDIVQFMETPQTGRRMLTALHESSYLHYREHVIPILHSQGDAAFLYLEKLNELAKSNTDLEKSDIDVIVYIAKKFQVKARNILENLLALIPHPAQESALIEAYLTKIGLVDWELYQKFRQYFNENNQNAIDQLATQVKNLKSKVIDGPMSEDDFESDIYSAVIFDTFPPAIGLTQEQYESLNTDRKDRQSDVPVELDQLQHKHVELSTGTYRVAEGEELDLNAWKDTSAAIRRVNRDFQAEEKSIPFNEEKTVEALINIYRTKKTTERDESIKVIELMYRYHRHQGGAKLDSEYSLSLDGLMNFKEFIGERVRNDLIWKCMSEWSKTHPAEFRALAAEIKDRVVHQYVGKLFSFIQQLKRAQSDELTHSLEHRITAELAPFNLSLADVTGKKSRELEQLLSSQIDLMEQSDSFLIHSFADALIDPMNTKMRKETQKFSFESSTGIEEVLPVEFVISKRREHGVAGYNMGVCVTPDRQLWNDPSFYNVIIFDRQQQQALGGMHFLIREGKLCLPGINPSMDLLSKVDAEHLYNSMIAYAHEVKVALGLKHVLIPVSPLIHSNRTAIQQVISQKKYSVMTLEREAKFSYSPYPYSFEECFVVE